jgi:hypothetical protein
MVGLPGSPDDINWVAIPYSVSFSVERRGDRRHNPSRDRDADTPFVTEFGAEATAGLGQAGPPAAGGTSG